MDSKHRLVVGAAILLVGAAAFWCGIAYARGAGPSRGQFAGDGAFSGRGGGPAGGPAGGGVFGVIIAKDTGSVTVQLMSGPNASSTGQTGSGTRIVFVNDTTQIEKTVSDSPADLATGESVVVSGQPNQDGSVTAQSIQIRPAGQSHRGQ